jgi:capsular exopolysaccharide synthesis family protein
MANVYEALRRAEEEKKRKIAGTVAPVPAVEWDPSPETARKARKKGFSVLNRGKNKAERLAAASGGSAEFNKRRIALLEPESFIAEQFRMLRSRLDSMAAESNLKTFAVASANAGEGKSNVSINLACVTAMSLERRVLLIDCDLRRPMIQRSLGLDPKYGLAEILLGQASADEAIVSVEGTNLDVIGVRDQPSNPSELLGSREMTELLAEMAGRYDRIFLDTPATLGLPDSRIIAEKCDGCLMVVRAGTTSREDVEAALEVLDRRRIVGLVLNGAEVGHERYAYY